MRQRAGAGEYQRIYTELIREAIKDGRLPEDRIPTEHGWVEVIGEPGGATAKERADEALRSRGIIK